MSAAPQIMFYHLVDQPVEAALTDLLEKSLSRGWRVGVQSNDADTIKELDNYIWTYKRDSFLPHAADYGANDRAGGTDKAQNAASQPIWLTTTSDNPNNAQVRFMIDLAHLEEPQQYERICYMFDGLDNDQLNHARTAWKALRGEGFALTYWQQSETGGWQKKASS